MTLKSCTALYLKVVAHLGPHLLDVSFESIDVQVGYFWFVACYIPYGTDELELSKISFARFLHVLL